MSKIGNMNLELQEQAEELGFETVQEALDNGYEVDYFKDSPDKDDLDYHPELVFKGQEQAHKAWLEEKEYTIAGLKNAKDFIETLCEKSGLAPAWRRDYERQARRIDRAITFIEEAHE